MALHFKKTTEERVPFISQGCLPPSAAELEVDDKMEGGRARRTRQRACPRRSRAKTQSRWVVTEAEEASSLGRDYAEERLACVPQADDDLIIDDTVVDLHEQEQLWEQAVTEEESRAEKLFMRHLRRRHSVYKSAGSDLEGFVEADDTV